MIKNALSIKFGTTAEKIITTDEIADAKELQNRVNGMYRKITEDISRWKQKEKRKPLIIVGARQVGKTYTIREFAEANYKDIIEYNFQDDADSREYFAKSHKAEDLITYIKLHHIGTPLTETTLVFFDEIQLCPELICELKFLSEKCSCDFIASGNMLGIRMHQMSSWPVGYVEMLTMYPMAFDEFVQALGLDDEIVDQIRSCISESEEIPQPIHDKFNQLFSEYMVCGGLPESVLAYLSGGIAEAVKVNRRLSRDYEIDIAHYAEAGVKLRAEECFRSVPLQLAKENKKFQYSAIRHGYNARHYEESLNWLESAGLIIKTYRLERIDKPLEACKEPGVFKVYSFDTGILVSQFDDADIYHFLADAAGTYKGALCENAMAVILKNLGIRNYYYEPNTSAEIDFVIPYQGEITPIEVKGGIHTRSKSFDNFIRNHESRYAFRFSKKNVGISDDGVTRYLPLYTAIWALAM